MDIDEVKMMKHTECTISISGSRTRQTRGFFVPGTNAPTVYGRDEKAEYKTLRGNTPRRLMPVVESRSPHKVGSKLEHKEADHG